MATVTTTGLVQEIRIVAGASLAYVNIGPAPDNVELLFVMRVPAETADQGAFHNSMLDALGVALVNRREVTVKFDDTLARITEVELVQV